MADNWVHVYSERGKPLWTQTTGNERPTAGFWSEDGNYFALGTASGSIFLLDGSSGKIISKLIGSRAPISKLRFSRDGPFLAVVSQDIDVHIFDLKNGSVIVARGHSAGQQDLQFSKDGTRLVTCARDGTVRMWDTATGRQTLMISSGANAVLGVALSDDEHTLYTSDSAGVVTKHSLSGPERQRAKK